LSDPKNLQGDGAALDPANGRRIFIAGGDAINDGLLVRTVDGADTAARGVSRLQDIDAAYLDGNDLQDVAQRKPGDDMGNWRSERAVR
jgi:hypothetical protein